MTISLDAVLNRFHRRQASASASQNAQPAQQQPQLPASNPIPRSKPIGIPGRDIFQKSEPSPHILTSYGKQWFEDNTHQEIACLSDSQNVPYAKILVENSPLELGVAAPLPFHRFKISLKNEQTPLSSLETIVLLEALLNVAEQERIRLLVEPNTPRQQLFYRKLGFNSLQRVLNHYSPNGQPNTVAKEFENFFAYDKRLASRLSSSPVKGNSPETKSSQPLDPNDLSPLLNESF